MSPFENSSSIRVAFYIRVSTEEQAKDWYGADMQLRGLEDMIKYKAQYFNWTHDKKYEYFDMGCTGADLNRPQYKKMIEDAKEGKFDIVAVWKIDRLSRNLSHLLGTFEILQNNKVGFYSLKENVDFSGPIWKLTFQIFGALAEFERETIKTRTKEGKVASARLWNYILNGVPFWFDKPKSEARTKRTLVINQDEERWVKRLFSEFLHWESLEWLARIMNDHKVLKSSGSVRKVRTTKWYPQNIRTDILENPLYIGRACYNSTQDDGSIVPIAIPVPRIISDLEFEMVQHKLERISRDAKRGGGENIYLLSRKIVDMETQGLSDRKFIGVHRTKGGHSYRRKQIELNGKIYPNREIPWERIDEFVWKVVEEALKRPEEIFKIYTAQSLDVRDYDRLSKERNGYGEDLEKVEEIEVQIEEEYHEGKHSEEMRDKLIKRNTEKQKALKAKIKDLDSRLDKIVQAQVTKEALLSFTEKLNTKLEDMSEETKNYLVDLLVDRVEVTFTKSLPIVHIVMRVAQTLAEDEGARVEPKKSSSKPKMANWSSDFSNMV